MRLDVPNFCIKQISVRPTLVDRSYTNLHTFCTIQTTFHIGFDGMIIDFYTEKKTKKVISRTT